jgi:hypothetical protein
VENDRPPLTRNSVIYVVCSLHFLEVKHIDNLAHNSPVPPLALRRHPLHVLAFRILLLPFKGSRLWLGRAHSSQVARYLFPNLGKSRDLSSTSHLPLQTSASQSGCESQAFYTAAASRQAAGPKQLRMGKEPFAVMGFMQGLVKRIPSSPNLPSLDDLKSEKAPALPGLSFFRRRIRLKGNSSISIPLGFVLLFPCIVVLLILIIVVQHPSSPGRILMPAGSPPSIR